MLQTYNSRVPIWARLVTAVAMLRVAAALALYLSGQVDAAFPTPVPLVVYPVLTIAFGALGTMLVVANRGDVRAAWLGGVLLLLAVPLTGPLLIHNLLPVAVSIDRIRPDAFLPAFLWYFLGGFPSALSGRFRRVVFAVGAALAVLGVAAFFVNVSLLIWLPDRLGWRAVLATGNIRGSVYWPMVLLPSIVAFVFLVGRIAASTGPQRARARIFIGGVAAGMVPLFLGVLPEAFSPAYTKFVHQPAIEPWIGLAMFGSLAVVPIVTTYSVIYDRVVEMRVVVRAAFQYLLARYTIIVFTTLPFIALALYLSQHQSEPLAILLAGRRPLLLIAAGTVGVFALRQRHDWLDALDRRFFREHHDAQLLLSRVMSGDVMSRDPADLADKLAAEIEQAMHAAADLYVADSPRARLRDLRGRHGDLPANSTLFSLAIADSKPMEVSVRAGSLLDRLPASEKEWLAAGNYQLIVALGAVGGHTAGLLALEGKRSGLPFSVADLRSLTALSAPVALALENHRLRQTPEPVTALPARECMRCSRLHAPEAVTCTCGASLSEALAPHVLRGVFRFERKIGAGGMGVVYLALDQNLGRQVAIKTLPRVTSSHVSRLRREAQAMASVQHPNLAVIYGIETWQDVPFLVEEYLAGGTLADRLRAARLDPEQALSLGVTLAEVLAHLHEQGVIHCDIKPSNIGFTSSNTAKLLDFGLVHLLRESVPASSREATISLNQDVDPSSSLVVTDRGVMGTPPYMSPEAIRAGQPGPAFDLWALAVVLYEAIAGQRPFEGRNSAEVFLNVTAGVYKNIRSVRADCSEAMAQFFERAFSSDPLRRPQTAHEFAASLNELRVSVH